MPYGKADLSDQPFNSLYTPCHGNFDKQCYQNNKILDRARPLDELAKNVVLNPRPLTTSRCNLEEYNRQCYVFPPQTENIVRKYGDKLDEKLCQQNFVNIDDESFLKNINTIQTKEKEFNIKQNIVALDRDISALEEPFLDPGDDFTVNQVTRRRNLVGAEREIATRGTGSVTIY